MLSRHRRSSGGSEPGSEPPATQSRRSPAPAVRAPAPALTLRRHRQVRRSGPAGPRRSRAPYRRSHHLRHRRSHPSGTGAHTRRHRLSHLSRTGSYTRRHRLSHLSRTGAHTPPAPALAGPVQSRHSSAPTPCRQCLYSVGLSIAMVQYSLSIVMSAITEYSDITVLSDVITVLSDVSIVLAQYSLSTATVRCTIVQRCCDSSLHHSAGPVPARCGSASALAPLRHRPRLVPRPEIDRRHAGAEQPHENRARAVNRRGCGRRIGSGGGSESATSAILGSDRLGLYWAAASKRSSESRARKRRSISERCMCVRMCVHSCVRSSPACVRARAPIPLPTPPKRHRTLSPRS
jgi:hypothetical protein